MNSPDMFVLFFSAYRIMLSYLILHGMLHNTTYYIIIQGGSLSMLTPIFPLIMNLITTFFVFVKKSSVVCVVIQTYIFQLRTSPIFYYNVLGE